MLADVGKLGALVRVVGQDFGDEVLGLFGDLLAGRERVIAGADFTGDEQKKGNLRIELLGAAGLKRRNANNERVANE